MFGFKKFVSILLWLVGSIACRTWRVKVIMPPSVNIFDPKGTPTVYCFWHSTLLVTAYVFRKTGKSVIVSPSKDGQRAADIAQRWGHSIIFGSSNKKGSTALRQSIRALKEGRSLGITPDGPKGPLQVAKPGAAQIALVSKCPLVAIKVEAGNAWRLSSWDKFLLPKPFSKITITLSEPIYPASCEDDNDCDDSSENRGVILTKQLEETFAA
ncbi:MAG: lysophospholipid acyltransferase family protein [Chitinispirillia bacterium]|nr:lysophospholipid acyltransferase family protein [Chitinispirillia bacterium]